MKRDTTDTAIVGPACPFQGVSNDLLRLRQTRTARNLPRSVGPRPLPDAPQMCTQVMAETEQVMTERQIIVTPASEWRPAPFDKNTWGPWRLDPEVFVLINVHNDYDVDLERCLTSAAVLDWYHQIAGKSWANDRTLAGLVRAVDDVLYPQSTLCGGALNSLRPTGKQLTRDDVKHYVRVFARKHPESLWSE